MSMYAKFQLHPPYGFCEEDCFHIFSSKIYPSCQPGTQSNFGQNIYINGGLLNKHMSEKIKYLQ